MAGRSGPRTASTGPARDGGEATPPPPRDRQKDTTMNTTTGPPGRAATPAGTSGTTAPAATPQQRMRAIVQAGYGSADVLRLEETSPPAIGAGEVLIRVRAAGLDRGTWHLMAGQPYLIRLVCGLRAPRNRVPGLDVAGTVVAA